MSPAQFKAIAQRAVENLPDEFKPYLADCMLRLEPRASPEQLRELDISDDEDLFGLYEGPALTERHLDDPPGMPPCITLFYEPLMDACESETELIHEIQVTILHEIGHHFGLDEERLEELGFG